MGDDDFHFDFGVEDENIDRPLHMIMQEEDCIIGHLLPGSDGSVWMLGAYLIDYDEEQPNSVALLEWPMFRLDPYEDVLIVLNADDMRLRHVSSQLTMGFINNIPFVCNSTRH